MIVAILYCRYFRRKVSRSQYKARINLEERLREGQNLDKVPVAMSDGVGSDPNCDKKDVILESGDLVGAYCIDDVPEYLYWNYEHVYKWMMWLDNGLFVGYQNELRQTLKAENEKGSHVSIIDRGDVKGWGIIDDGHRQSCSTQLKEVTLNIY